MPIPVSATESVIQVSAVLLALVSSNSHGALLRELAGVAHEVQQRLPQFDSSIQKISDLT